MPRSFKNMLTLALLSTLLISGSISAKLSSGWAANRGTVVVFDANWCASCREIMPIARDVASQNSLGFAEIDIDFQDAPKQARSHGLSIPNDEPPQVFYVNRGRSVLLYSGRNYKFGSGDSARATILQNLQRVLGSGN